jgi:hypothetical protein
MKIEVSVGEVIDKYSILELKKKYISDNKKLKDIEQELDILHECLHIIHQNKFLYKLLKYTNEEIWNMTNKIKKLSVNDSEFSVLSNKIFEFNQKRFRVKNLFNFTSCSTIKEHKSYDDNNCIIVIHTIETILDKISEINFLSLEYDFIIFECNSSITHFLQNIFKTSNFIYNNIDTIDVKNKIILTDFFIDNNLKILFEFEPIKYISSGLLGDFMHQLSVINEMFYKTGRKGDLFISDIYGEFRQGVEKAYKDTYDIIITQRYIHSYKIFNDGENFDINLSSWRNNFSYDSGWPKIFNEYYNIPWGIHKWLQIKNEEKWNNKILISTTPYRFPDSFDYNTIINKYGHNNCIYISQDVESYNNFVTRTGITPLFYKANSLYDLVVCINSCKLFIGNLSSPLTFALACKQNIVVSFDSNWPLDTMVNSHFNQIANNIYYSFDYIDNIEHKICSNLRILYGNADDLIDVTHIAIHKFYNNGIITIPNDSELLQKIFGSKKLVFIIDYYGDKHEFTEAQEVKININGLLM